jgi:hypothetical protein
MKILRIAKSILLTALLFVAQKAFAAEGAPEYSEPVLGLWSVAGSWLFLFGILTLFLSGAISPIIGYRWYIKHGGAKKWLKWLAYLPLVLIGLMIIFPWVKHALGPSEL